jgi:hypothetical protein
MTVRIGAALFSILSLVAAACGQKPGVHAAAVAEGQAGIPGVGTGAVFDPATGTFVDPATGQPIGAPGTAGTGTTGTAGTSPTGSAEGSASEVGKTIVVGLHAPVTGAAPVRSDSFNTGKDLYWKGKTVHGRTVKVVFRDDQYNPSTARAKCQEMVEDDKALILIGGAGTDQIKACADFAAANQIPYLSAGVLEDALRSNPYYFAVSMSYKQQGRLLAQYIKANRSKFRCSGACKVTAIITDTANFDDAVQGFTSAYSGVRVIRPSKSARGSQYADDICANPADQPDVVYPLTSPTFFLELEGSAACNPQYVGVGISMGLDTVANVGCESPTGSMNGARFFSPAYSYTEANQQKNTNDKQFKRAGGSDDIQFLLWGLMKTLHQMLDKVGPNLSRASFLQTVQASSFKTGVYPPLKYSSSNHFGANQVHVLRANCNTNRFVTESKFRSSF